MTPAKPKVVVPHRECRKSARARASAKTLHPECRCGRFRVTPRAKRNFLIPCLFAAISLKNGPRGRYLRTLQSSQNWRFRVRSVPKRDAVASGIARLGSAAPELIFATLPKRNHHFCTCELPSNTRSTKVPKSTVRDTPQAEALLLDLSRVPRATPAMAPHEWTTG